MQPKLVNQPTAAMTRKQFASAMAGGSATVGLWAVDFFGGIPIPIEVGGTIITMAAMAAGYLARERKS